MIELKKSQYSVVEKMYTGITHSRPIVYSVLGGQYEGKVFADKFQNSEIALVVLEDFLFLGGNPKSIKSYKQIYDLIYERVFPDQKWNYLEFHTLSEQWSKVIKNIFKDKIQVNRNRKTFALNKNRLKKC